MRPGTVVTRDRWRRWLTVAAGVAVVLAAPALVGTLPVSSTGIDAEALRERIMASGRQPYSGYAESAGRLGVPALPRLDELAALLSGTTRMRVWYAAPDRWRVDDLAPAGERGTYRLGDTEFVWDYGDERLTRIEGQAPARVPRPADLVPPELARRLLALAAADPVTRLPARRVAGVDAAGLRLIPTDPSTTVGAVDVWADPDSGLPLLVRVSARGVDRPVLESRLLEVSMAAPPERVLTPSTGAGSAVGTARAADVTGLLRGLGAAAPPPRLAGRALVAPPGELLPGIGRYGEGLSTFVVVPLTGRLASQVLEGARDAGAATVEMPSVATAMRLQTPVVTLVVIRSRRLGYLLAGAVTAEVLERAAVELAGGSPG